MEIFIFKRMADNISPISVLEMGYCQYNEYQLIEPPLWTIYSKKEFSNIVQFCRILIEKIVKNSFQGNN